MQLPARLIYSTDRFRFAEVARLILGISDLTAIPDIGPLLTPGFDQFTEYHNRWYAEEAEFFDPLYRDFLTNHIKAFFGDEPIIYQTVPTFRIHLKDNIAVGSWHRDSEYNHAPYEVNFWLPFTPAFDSNTIWLPRGTTFEPMRLEYGQYLAFNGADTWHGNVPNLTGQTRVSVDFRAFPASAYQPSDKKTVATGRSLTLGDYWNGPI